MGDCLGRGEFFSLRRIYILIGYSMKFCTKNLRISQYVDFTSTLLRGLPALKFHQQRALRAHQTRGEPQILWDAHQIYTGLIILQGEPRCSAMALTPPPPPSIPHLSHSGLYGLVHFTWPHAALGLISRPQLMATIFSAAPRQNTDVATAGMCCLEATCPPKVLCRYDRVEIGNGNVMETSTVFSTSSF